MARDRAVAGGGEAINIGLGDKAALDKLQRAVEISLRQIGFGTRDFDLRAGAADLLRLDRAIDDREHLTLADPVARIDGYGNDAAALADHADGHFASCGQRPGGGDLAFDRGLARRNDGHRGELAVAIGSGYGFCTGHLPGDRSRDQRGDDKTQCNEQPSAAARAIFCFERFQIAGQGLPPLAHDGRFVVHRDYASACRPCGCII